MSPPAPVDAVLPGTSDTVSARPLTVEGVASWRAKATRPPTTVAPPVNSDMFKSPVRSGVTRPPGCHTRADARLASIAIRNQRRSDGIVGFSWMYCDVPC